VRYPVTTRVPASSTRVIRATEDRLFARFRRTGDPGALAEVFDRTAPELLRVACYLAGDRHLAEDALQSTFLHAIEHAGRWDARQRVLPWLMGLLANRVHELRRDTGRTPDPRNLEPRRQLDPGEAAEQGEMQAAFQQALDAVPEPYRAAVENHLVQGKSPGQVARELGIRAGTARMRLHRGLEQLRRRLPHGVAPALFAVPEPSGSVLTSIRQVVLTEASRTTAAGSVTGTSLLIGTLAMKKIVLAVLALVVLTFGLLEARLWPATEAPEAPASGRLADTTVDAADVPQLAEPADVFGARERTAWPTARLDTAWTEPLAALTGRIVEANGTPIPGLSLTLFEGDPRFILVADESEAGPRLHRATTVTDPQGRFRFDGAYDAAPHALGLDLGGPRAQVQQVEAALVHGEVIDLGDITARSGLALHGRVVDPGGRPVEGARVRVVPADASPALVALLVEGLQDLRRGSAVGLTGMAEADAAPVLEAPEVLRRHLDDFSIPTTRTDAEGRYELPAAPTGDLYLAADHEGWVGASQRVTSQVDGQQLADLRLAAGRTVAGVVVDGTGAPVAGVEVLAGSRLEVDGLALLQPAGVTGPDGRFEVTGCSVTHRVMAAARRTPDAPWTTAIESSAAPLEVTLKDPLPLSVRVLDGSGDPVLGARLQLSPAHDPRSPTSLMAPFLTAAARSRDSRLVDAGQGTYSCAAVTPGGYVVTVHHPDLPLSHHTIDVDEEHTDFELTCAVGRTLAVSVLEAGTGLPVAEARVTVFGPGSPFLTQVASARTSSTGEATLGRIPRDPDGLVRPVGPVITYLVEELGYAGSELTVVVQHPDHADVILAVPDERDRMRVSLERGGEVTGLIRQGGDPPRARHRVILERSEEGRSLVKELLLSSRIARTDRDGSFRFVNVPPSRYRLRVVPDTADRGNGAGAFGLLLHEVLDREVPADLHREEPVFVRPSEITELAIDLSPSGLGTASRLSGSIRLDGLPVPGASIAIWQGGQVALAETDRDGRFRTELFSFGGDVIISVKAVMEYVPGVERSLELFRERQRIEPGSEERLDLDVNSHRVSVTVTGSGGEPLPGALVAVPSLRAAGQAPGVSTDAGGRAEIWVTAERPHTLMVSREGYGERSLPYDPATSGASITVSLTPPGEPAPVSGTCDISALASPVPSGPIFLSLVGDNTRRTAVMLDPEDLADDGRAAFRFDSLPPGAFEVQVMIQGEMSLPQRLEVPPGGASDIELTFQPR